MEQKTTLFVLLILLLTILQTESKNINRSKPDRFIESSCRATRYPSLCLQTLSAYATKIRHNDQDLAVAALTISLTRAKAAASFVSKLIGSRALGRKEVSKINRREYLAVKDCAETLRDGVARLGESMKEFRRVGHADATEDFMWRMSNVQTWVSAALTDVTTCLDGIGGRATEWKVKSMVRNRVVHVAQVTSNALALVNRFAERRSVKNP